MPESERFVDLSSWPRREHYERFAPFRDPRFSMCAEMDLTAALPAAKERGIRLNTLVTYVVARAANDEPSFRLRIRGERVVEHAVVHPCGTVMAAGDLFSFAFFEYDEDLEVFAAGVDAEVARVRAAPSLDDPPGRDDLLFMSAIPWVAFTAFEHPMPGPPDDSIPRFAWGRCRDVGGRWSMPLGVQAHHALMDGLHMGRYYERATAYFAEPGSYLG